ncbi:MAG TPA: NADP-dependent oxidoreductase [Candidatus Acidoferrales bacterium]|jgi:NADPH-dependent curcumin reductase CurA|nr:NADP-dependent oxidoreductase [Candidatus Acidoferrales bacterium]
MNSAKDAREVHLVTRPIGWPQPHNFAVERRLVKADDGQALVHNRFLSVDPYMRGRMNDVKSYVPPFALGEVMDGGAVGEVVSAPPGGSIAPGDQVIHNLGWREYSVGPPEAFQLIDPVPGTPLSTYLGALGMPGLTAYVGLLDVAALQPGESVFISAAAGAVGSLAGQLAKLHGAERVIGSAGSDRKIEHLTSDLGFDAAFNYRGGDVTASLRQAAGERGIDVYFDNVGGDQLEAALTMLNRHGRVALCGSVSRYNSEGPQPGPRNLALAIGKRLRLQGFLVTDHEERRPEFIREVGDHIAAGRIKVDQTVVVGIENMAEAFIAMLRGANVGKMVVQLND